MSVTSRRRGRRAGAALLTVASLVAIASSSFTAAFAAGPVSFDDWLARQSTRCKDLDGDGTCCEPVEDQYIPADRSFIYWTSVADGRAAIVDYLGVSSEYLATRCGLSLGTTVTGSISMRRARGGQVLVGVTGHTRNAVAFVTDDPFNASGNVIFGATEATICEGASASLVDANFHIEYYADAGQPIADLQWFGNPPPAIPCETADDPFTFRFISFHAAGDGLMPDGRRAHLTVTQTGTLQSHSNSPKYDGFPAESIEIKPIGK